MAGVLDLPVDDACALESLVQSGRELKSNRARVAVWLWPDIHMTPAEGVQAHLDLQGGRPHGVLLPIHWGTFNLAPHAWAEPGEWTADAAAERGQPVASPRPGEPFEPAGDR